MTDEIAAVGVATPGAREAIDAVAVDFQEFAGSSVSEDPLGWSGYREHLERAQQRSGETESVIAGLAHIGAAEVVILSFDFRFMGGSMGEATGRRIVQALREARNRRLTLVSLVASGGARVQEGMRSLIQMRRVAQEVARNRADGIPHVAVLRNPCTGGVWVSLAASADVILAVRGSTVAFAGHRVRGATGDEAAFTSSGKFASGCVDREVDADDAPEALRVVVKLLERRSPLEPLSPPPAPANSREPLDAWETVRRTREPGHPRASDYLDLYFDERFRLSGDRAGGLDAGIDCGLARCAERTAVYVAQVGRPVGAAGYRTVRRMLDLAERLRLPVLSLIDTPGAANDAIAETEGIGTAMSEVLVAMAELTVPVTSVVIGEGGSGGALALASDDLWAAPTSWFAVIAPESAASILRRPPEEIAELSSEMAIRPVELRRLGIIRGTLAAPGLRSGP